MYELYIGSYERVMNGRIVYHKVGKEFIPCTVTNYYFKTRKYTLVPVEDMETIPLEKHSHRRVYGSTKIYIKVEN